MSAPHIIWTMQRTGGTTLAGLLSTLSDFPGVEHEPFNHERLYGWVVRNWQTHRDTDDLTADITKALEKRPVIKHCYELLPPALNQTLLRVSTELGYLHIILDRRAEVKRILSLELAKQTGAWGGKEAREIFAEIKDGTRTLAPMDIEAALQHLEACQQRRRDLVALFQDAGIDPFVVYFEDVYSDFEAGSVLVRALIDFLEIDIKAQDKFEKMVEDALRHKGQNSARVMDAIPNIEETRAALWDRVERDPLFRFVPTRTDTSSA